MQNEHTPMGEGAASAVDAVVEKAQELGQAVADKAQQVGQAAATTAGNVKDAAVQKAVEVKDAVVKQAGVAKKAVVKKAVAVKKAAKKQVKAAKKAVKNAVAGAKKAVSKKPAKKAAKKEKEATEYQIMFIEIADTNPPECLFYIDKWPSLAYRSLYSETLRLWVSYLPKGTTIMYLPSCLGPHKFTAKELDDFEAYCKSKGILFPRYMAG